MQIVSRLRSVEKRLDNLAGSNLPLLVMYDYTRMTAEEIALIPKHTGAIVKDFTAGGQRVTA